MTPAIPANVPCVLVPGSDENPNCLVESAILSVIVTDSTAPFVVGEIGPGAEVKTDQQLEAYVRHTAVTAHHPAGTCKMGPTSDKMAVVDTQLRVIGLDALRVADASVFPDLVGGNINAPVIMIAEKAADIIRGKPPLSPPS